MNQSERLPENASVLDRLVKFQKITDLLRTENIFLKEVSGGCPILEDKSCGFVLTHNLITWEVYPVQEVADMIIKARNSYIERKA